MEFSNLQRWRTLDSFLALLVTQTTKDTDSLSERASAFKRKTERKEWNEIWPRLCSMRMKEIAQKMEIAFLSRQPSIMNTKKHRENNWIALKLEINWKWTKAKQKEIEQRNWNNFHFAAKAWRSRTVFPKQKVIVHWACRRSHTPELDGR